MSSDDITTYENDYNERLHQSRFNNSNTSQQLQPAAAATPDVMSLSMQRDYSDSAYATTRQEDEITKLLSTYSKARELATMNASRTCQYCKAPVQGMDAPERNYSPMAEHWRTCQPYQQRIVKREQFYEASRSIEAAGRDVVFFMVRKAEIERDLFSKLADIIDLNLQHGRFDLCSSSEEWFHRYDGGRKDTTEVMVTNFLGTAKGRKERVIRDFPLERKGEEITRRCDDLIQSFREKYPDVMTIIDAELAGLKGAKR